MQAPFSANVEQILCDFSPSLMLCSVDIVFKAKELQNHIFTKQYADVYVEVIKKGKLGTRGFPAESKNAEF